MKKFTGFCLLVVCGLLAAWSTAALAASTEVVPGIPVKDTVTLVDVGATTCVQCRLMAPLLDELKEEYKDRAAVIVINVYDPANAGKAEALKVMAIPTQIFYDRQGREVFRNLGFLDKKAMAAKLDELLAQ